MNRAISYLWRELVYRMDGESIRAWLMGVAAAVGFILATRALCRLIAIVMGWL